jgi:hypothetical protein
MPDKAMALPVESPRIGAVTMEKVLLHGDLKSLTPAERVSYHDSVCRSLGLNPLTRPFEYLLLNNRLILYAKRECTEQLRQIRNVSLQIKAREVTEGCYVVTAMATLPDGRSDESVGAVPIDGLKGEGRANAMMKAETKAKRRVTLSICGLAFLDESEVASVPDASPAAIDPETGEDLRPWRTFKEMLARFAELKEQLGEEHYYQILAGHGIAHANEFKQRELALAVYDEMKEALGNFPQAPPETT